MRLNVYVSFENQFIPILWITHTLTTIRRCRLPFVVGVQVQVLSTYNFIISCHTCTPIFPTNCTFSLMENLFVRSISMKWKNCISYFHLLFNDFYVKISNLLLIIRVVMNKKETQSIEVFNWNVERKSRTWTYVQSFERTLTLFIDYSNIRLVEFYWK